MVNFGKLFVKLQALSQYFVNHITFLCIGSRKNGLKHKMKVVTSFLPEIYKPNLR